MELMRHTLARLAAQYESWSTAQRMFAGSLLVILAMTIAWWTRYGSTGEMVSLLGEQTLSQEDLVRIPTELRGRAITVQVVDGRIQVPASRQIEAMAILGYNDLLPADTTRAYDQLISEQLGSPWESATVTRERLVATRAAAMRQVLRTMQDVRDAHVLLNIDDRRGFGQQAQPTGAVHITTRSGKPNRQLAQAARGLVAGGTGIDPIRVNVTIDDQPMRGPDDPSALSAGSNDQLEQAAAYERRFAEKIQEQLSHIPGAKATVTVHLDATSTRQTSRKFDSANTFSKETTAHVRRDQTLEVPAASPGVLANVGASVDDVPVTGGTANATEDQETTSQILPSYTDEQVSVPAGRITAVAAGVQIPMSYFRRQWQARNPGSTDPSDSALLPIIDAGKSDVEAIVRACLGGDGINPEVSVRTYADLIEPQAPPVAEASMVSTSFRTLLTGHAREIAVGALAVFSLAIVSQLARRSAMPAMAGVDPRDTRSHATDTAEDALRARQAVENVRHLVREDPDAAADLIRRWMQR